MSNYTIKRTDAEINDQLNMADAWDETGGSALVGMTYEQGVAAGIRWVTGDPEQDMPIENGPGGKG